jgi:hypothetical protein
MMPAELLLLSNFTNHGGTFLGHAQDRRTVVHP